MAEVAVVEEDNRKTCWVCFATEDDDRAAPWVRPCRCKGTSKWVHQQCLQRWVDEKQRGDSTTKVSCPQCNTEYLIIFPKFGPFVYILDLADRIIYKVCPMVAGGVFIGSVYWTACTYGVVTVLQVLGHKEGLSVMESADPVFLLIGLPTIPIMLILAKMVRWEDYVLRFWQRHVSKSRILNYILGSDLDQSDAADRLMPTDPGPMFTASRVLCGALIMPTIATIFGKLCFGSVESNFQRTLLGGIGFVAMKGVLRIYFKQQQYKRHGLRSILDWDEPEADNSTQT